MANTPNLHAGNVKKLAEARIDKEKYSNLLRTWTEMRFHFAENVHSGFWLAPVELMPVDFTDEQRKTREVFWILKIRSILGSKVINVDV
jgi:hypothetical protein